MKIVFLIVDFWALRHHGLIHWHAAVNVVKGRQRVKRFTQLETSFVNNKPILSTLGLYGKKKPC